MKKNIKRLLVYMIFFAYMGIGMIAFTKMSYARDGEDYGASTSFTMSGKKWSKSWGDWSVYQPIENYLQITVKGKNSVSKLRYRKQYTNTWYYINLADKKWKYNSTKGTSTVTIKLKSMNGFLEVQLYDSVSTKRKATLKLTGKITKKPEISTITRPSSTSAKITWKKFTCTTYVDILRAESANGKYTKVASVYFGDGSYTDKGLKAGRKYYYKLRLCHIGRNGKIYSPSCAYKSVTMPSATVTQTPVYLNNSWVKTGSYYAKINRSRNASYLYYKDMKGSVRTISNKCSIAVGEGNTLYYQEWGSAPYYLVQIYSFNMKTGIRVRICCVDGSFLGYYKGEIYYSQGHCYANAAMKAYRLNISTGRITRVAALDKAGWSCQYKNYMTVLNDRNDPSPTTFRIYNMSTGKVVKTVTRCTSFKIIKGKVYYSVCNNNSSSYVQTIYRCNLNGTSVTKLASYSGSYMPPNLESSYMYFPSASGNTGTCIKYYYSTKQTVRVSDTLRNDWSIGIRY